uniref:Uncharacterized protein n=1 Tax=Panagrolaimus sp. PS1159 TaxID=55785 RepID=A0AC35GDJ7_9BILA
MGVDGEDKKGDRCLCDLLHVRHGALIVAGFELIFILYEIATTIWFFDKNDDYYILAVSLILFSFALALIAVVLLIFGVQKQNHLLIVPHLIMQCAIILASFLFTGYLTLLLIGGTSVEVETIFYEDSGRGEIGLSQSSRYAPIELSILTRGLRNMLLLFILFTIAFLAFQIWFFFVVRKCYRYLYRFNIEKSLTSNGSTDTKSSKL